MINKVNDATESSLNETFDLCYFERALWLGILTYMEELQCDVLFYVSIKPVLLLETTSFTKPLYGKCAVV